MKGGIVGQRMIKLEERDGEKDDERDEFRKVGRRKEMIERR